MRVPLFLLCLILGGASQGVAQEPVAAVSSDSPPLPALWTWPPPDPARAGAARKDTTCLLCRRQIFTTSRPHGALEAEAVEAGWVLGGALVGGLMGAASGFGFVYYASNVVCDSNCGVGTEEVIGAAVGGAAGMLVGAGVGALISKLRTPDE